MALNVTVIKCLSDNYAYLLHETEADIWALIDAPEAAPIISAIEAAGGRLDMILLTHHHYDHVDGVPELAAKYHPQIVGAAADASRLPALDIAVSEGDRIKVGAQEAEIFDVSGHTIGHIAFYFPQSGDAFTADSLMALGCGRLFEGTALQMWESLSKLAALPDTTHIWSGHNYLGGNAAFAKSIEPNNADLDALIERLQAKDAKGEPIVPLTLAQEKSANPFLRAIVPSVKASVGLPEADDAAVFAEIRRRKDNF